MHYISHIWVSKIIWCQNEILCHSSHNVEVKDDLFWFQLMCVHSYPCNSWSLKWKCTLVSFYDCWNIYNNGLIYYQLGGMRLRLRNHTFCPMWTLVKVKVFRWGLDDLTDGWILSTRSFSIYMPKNGQACWRICNRQAHL